MSMPVPARPSWGRRSRWKTYHQATVPSQHYTERITTPLLRTGQAIVANGTATVSFTVTGLGCKWYPMTVTVSTTTGATDGSKASVYFGVAVNANLVNGQRYNGGRDTMGLAIPFMTPGDVLIVQWTGAHNGDVATASLVGTQDNLAA